MPLPAGVFPDLTVVESGLAFRGLEALLIARFFAPAQRWRGIATRFDKLAITYRAGIAFCTLLTWTRLLGGAS